jgi:hypothetical protein
MDRTDSSLGPHDAPADQEALVRLYARLIRLTPQPALRLKDQETQTEPERKPKVVESRSFVGAWVPCVPMMGYPGLTCKSAPPPP